MSEGITIQMPFNWTNKIYIHKIWYIHIYTLFNYKRNVIRILAAIWKLKTLCWIKKLQSQQAHILYDSISHISTISKPMETGMFVCLGLKIGKRIETLLLKDILRWDPKVSNVDSKDKFTAKCFNPLVLCYVIYVLIKFSNNALDICFLETCLPALTSESVGLVTH